MATALQAPPAVSAQVPPSPAPAAARYLALDAFRGFILVVLVSGGFGFRQLLEVPGFRGIASQFEHVEWTGAVFWDLIQPAFIFMVGMAMPFSFAARAASGESPLQRFTHVLARAAKLILLSQVLMCMSSQRLYFQLINVLCQIALAYVVAYLVLQLPAKWQATAALGFLAGHWALFAAFPGPEGAFSRAGNIGAVIDQAWLGRTYSGFYVTLNFLTSAVTILFGAWTAELVRTSMPQARRLAILAAAIAGCFALSLAIAPWNPIVKRLWTSSFALYSAGWVLAMFGGFYLVIEVAGLRRWTFPFVVAGANSIFLYSISIVLGSWIRNAVGVFTGKFAWIGTMAPVAHHCAGLLAMWGLCFWLYRRKIFFKL